MGKLPAWAKTKLAAEDNSTQVSLFVCLFVCFIVSVICICFIYHIFYSSDLNLSRTRRELESPVGLNEESSSHSRFCICLYFYLVFFFLFVFEYFCFGFLYLCLTIVSATAPGGGGRGLQQHGLSSNPAARWRNRER